MFRKTRSERKYSALDIDPAVYSNFAWLTISAIKAVPHDLCDLRPVRDTDIPQCPVIEFYQNSDNLFDLTFATPVRPSASNRAPGSVGRGRVVSSSSPASVALGLVDEVTTASDLRRSRL